MRKKIIVIVLCLFGVIALPVSALVALFALTNAGCNIENGCVKGVSTSLSPTETPFPSNTPTSTPVHDTTSKTRSTVILPTSQPTYSNVKCPDGYGNYVIESDRACKERWDKISEELKKSASDLSKAYQEQNRLQNAAIQSQYKDPVIPTFDYVPQPTQKLEDITTVLPKSDPTPTSQPGGGYFHYQGF